MVGRARLRCSAVRQDAPSAAVGLQEKSNDSQPASMPCGERNCIHGRRLRRARRAALRRLHEFARCARLIGRRRPPASAKRRGSGLPQVLARARNRVAYARLTRRAASSSRSRRSEESSLVATGDASWTTRRRVCSIDSHDELGAARRTFSASSSPISGSASAGAGVAVFAKVEP